MEEVVPAPELKRSRYISVHDDRVARLNNVGEGCVFEDVETGRRCGSHYQEQPDHIIEFSSGGSSSAANLWFYCAKHNRYCWRTLRSP